MTRHPAPVADRRDHVATYHGIARNDPYHWLRADNWREVMQDPNMLPANIRIYLEAENSYFEQGFGARTTDLQDAIYKEIRGRIKEDDSGVPSPHGPFAYNSKMLEGHQYPVLVRTPRAGGDEPEARLMAGEKQAPRLWMPQHWPAWLLLGCLRLLAPLPWSLLLWGGRWLGRVMFHLVPVRRAVTLRNLELCFPALAAKERRRLARRCYESFGMGAMEALIAYYSPPERFTGRSPIDGAEHLEAARAAHRRGRVHVRARAGPP